ncbi:FUSC family protein [Pseudochelatococcus contaminans]|uniref:Multidrug resistance protein MdtO n=1 Tax=Pseudochelatococcus contaminans TaxID=1538103 RepID=A0A7W6EFI0_9HYPH|nr:FUSC family protein [Pseudochelatococcus contaminans]MBB3808342.1 multidrug resistance protein MdtO [Pseudochelatococcus contaminans]
MERAADPGPWGAIGQKVWHDLFVRTPGRFALTWRVALMCALAAGVAMMYHVPESAIGCYLIIFLARPNAAQCVGQALGVIVLSSIVVLTIGSLIEWTAESALLRIAVIAGISFAFVFLGAASQLGEQGSIVALVVAFILTLVDDVPAGEIVTRALIYAWQMACMPMALMIVFYLIFGTSPNRLMRDTVADRLDASAKSLESGDGGSLRDPLGEGNADTGQQAMLARLFNTAPGATVTWLLGAAMNSYRLMLAVAAQPVGLAADVREKLANACRAGAEAVRAGKRPQGVQTEGVAQNGATGSTALDTIYASLSGFVRDNGGSGAQPLKQPFFAPDALTNPDYQLYALKTTAAAVTCYLIYSLIGWQGIHTAMITCYVAALGTTAETVHKLTQRICGCLIGAAMGFGSILFIIPHLESVGGLMVLVFLAILVAAWVSTGSEIISYGGVQIGLAFLLTILNGFSPSYSMSSGWDRIVGILLGNLVVYIYFTSFWPKSAATAVRSHLSDALLALSRMAAMPAQQRIDALAEAEIVETQAGQAREQLLLLPFEPASQRPDRARVVELEALTDEMRALSRTLMFSDQPAHAEGVDTQDADAIPERLRQVATLIQSGARHPGVSPATETDTSGDIGSRVTRIERLAAGVQA